MPDPVPIQLSYGRQAPVWRRGKTIIFVLVLLGLIAGAYFAWQPAQNWYARWQYQRAAMRWYQSALTWSEPPTKQKYTENPADFKLPGANTQTLYDEDGNAVTGLVSRTGLTDSRCYGGSAIERPPALNGESPCPAASNDQILLLAHQRTTKVGFTRLVAVGQPFFIGNKLQLRVDLIDLFKGKPTVMHGGRVSVDMTGICVPGEIRLYAGQDDPNDSARFSIPFEARGRHGWIDGNFISGRTFSKDPAKAKIEQEINSEIVFAIRMEPTSKPTTQFVP